jgi:hypothetical protein
MYSEHVVAILLSYARGAYPTGDAIDSVQERRVVEIGRLLGPELGVDPSDKALGWFASAYGTAVPLRTRAAVHILPDGRVGFGLGHTRGVIESTGGHLTIVTNPEPGRYLSAWRLPTIEYGGLI